MYVGNFYQHLSKPPFEFRGFLFVSFKYTVCISSSGSRDSFLSIRNAEKIKYGDVCFIYYFINNVCKLQLYELQMMFMFSLID